jgi:hypothetical protein
MSERVKGITVCAGNKKYTAAEMKAYINGYIESSKVTMEVLKTINDALKKHAEDEDLDRALIAMGLKVISDITENVGRISMAIMEENERITEMHEGFETMEEKEETVRH